MSDKKKDSTSAQQRPTRLQVSVRFLENPANNSFTRKLRFEHECGEFIFVPIALRKQSGLIWNFDTAAGYLSSESSVRSASGKALHQLGRLVDLGNRSYWDKMVLANTGGSTELKIAHVQIALSYGGIGYHLPRWIHDKTFIIVNSSLNATLVQQPLSFDNNFYSSRGLFICQIEPKVISHI
ncbi:MAG: hypothetical protein D3910_04845 [Candidatus Electrothrix sp. ATG2]|nr:hypothetical protein [Candidatus Electrothrix sp. ATG2]